MNEHHTKIEEKHRKIHWQSPQYPLPVFLLRKEGKCEENDEKPRKSNGKRGKREGSEGKRMKNQGKVMENEEKVREVTENQWKTKEK